MIELLAALWLFGPMFWVAALLALGVCTAFYANERYWQTGVVVLIGAVILSWLAHFNVFQWVRYNSLNLIMYAGIYLGVGILFSLLRFIIFTFDASADLTDYCREYGYNRKALTKTQMATFISYSKYKSIPLKVTDYRRNLTVWTAYWPISAASVVMQKPVKWIIRISQEIFRSTLQMISNKAFGDVKIISDEEAAHNRPDAGPHHMSV